MPKSVDSERRKTIRWSKPLKYYNGEKPKFLGQKKKEEYQHLLFPLIPNLTSELHENHFSSISWFPMKNNESKNVKNLIYSEVIVSICTHCNLTERTRGIVKWIALGRKGRRISNCKFLNFAIKASECICKTFWWFDPKNKRNGYFLRFFGLIFPN